MKKFLTFILICTTVLTTAVFAKEDAVEDGFQARFSKIVETSEDSKYGQVLTEDEMEQGDKDPERMFLYTKDVPTIDLKTGELIEDYKFNKGEKIEYFYKNNTPVMMSYPAKMTPDVIAVNVEDAKYSLDVDHFDKEGRGVSNRLVINVNENTVFENLKGEEVENSLDKDLAVLYTVATRSLPPIANPNKVIVLDSKDKVVDINDYKLEDKDLVYLRNYYEALGAEIEWDGDEFSTKISIGDKSVDIKNSDKKLMIKDEVIEMDDFEVKDGTSYISEKYVEMINDYLLESELQK